MKQNFKPEFEKNRQRLSIDIIVLANLVSYTRIYNGDKQPK